MKRETIIKNAAKCLYCGDIIESKHRHDFVFCTCKSLAVDGGKAYLKRSFTQMSMYEDMSEVIEEDDDDDQRDIK